MTAGQNGDQHPLDDLFLAENEAADGLLDAGNLVAGLLDRADNVVVCFTQ